MLFTGAGKSLLLSLQVKNQKWRPPPNSFRVHWLYLGQCWCRAEKALGAAPCPPSNPLACSNEGVFPASPLQLKPLEFGGGSPSTSFQPPLGCWRLLPALMPPLEWGGHPAQHQAQSGRAANCNPPASERSETP